MSTTKPPKERVKWTTNRLPRSVIRAPHRFLNFRTSPAYPRPFRTHHVCRPIIVHKGTLPREGVNPSPFETRANLTVIVAPRANASSFFVFLFFLYGGFQRRTGGTLTYGLTGPRQPEAWVKLEPRLLSTAEVHSTGAFGRPCREGKGRENRGRGGRIASGTGLKTGIKIARSIREY